MAPEQAVTSTGRTGSFRVLVVFLSAAVVLVAGCSGDRGEEEGPTIADTAEELIASKISVETGLGELRPSCDEEIEAAVGANFECTAVTDQQRTVKLAGRIDESGHLEVVTSNVIRAEALPSFEAEAARALNFQVGTNLGNDAVDCGDEPVVLNPDQTMLCAVTDPNTNEVFDLTMTMTDLEARQFKVEVGVEPRAE